MAFFLLVVTASNEIELERGRGGNSASVWNIGYVATSWVSSSVLLMSMPEYYCTNALMRSLDILSSIFLFGTGAEWLVGVQAFMQLAYGGFEFYNCFGEFDSWWGPDYDMENTRFGKTLAAVQDNNLDFEMLNEVYWAPVFSYSTVEFALFFGYLFSGSWVSLLAEFPRLLVALVTSTYFGLVPASAGSS